MTNERIALVLGATGGIGGEVASRLIQRGWTVRALTRNVEQAQASRKSLHGIKWVAGDAMRASDVIAAAHGASVIVHAVNPPGYRDWDKLVLPMLENTISAAYGSGARILFPGTVYNFGPETFPVPREDSPQKPLTRKGAIRVEMERRLRVASESGVRVVIVRAGDFFGGGARNNWFSQGLVKPGRPVTTVTYPGGPGVGHAWAYLPDVAETMIRLLEHEDRLSSFETFHFAGHWDSDGTQLIQAIRRVTGNPSLRVWSFPWPLVTLLSPFVTLFREMMEMRYLWRVPLRLDNSRLTAVLGKEPHTDLDTAIRDSLVALGCLPQAPAAAALGRVAR